MLLPVPFVIVLMTGASEKKSHSELHTYTKKANKCASSNVLRTENHTKMFCFFSYFLLCLNCHIILNFGESSSIQILQKCVKDGCGFGSDPHFSFKHFLKDSLEK